MLVYKEQLVWACSLSADKQWGANWRSAIVEIRGFQGQVSMVTPWWDHEDVGELLPTLHFSNQAHSCVKRLQPGAAWLHSAGSCCSRLCSSLLSSKVREKQSICELQQEGARGPPWAKGQIAMVKTDACYYWILHSGCINSKTAHCSLLAFTYRIWEIAVLQC